MRRGTSPCESTKGWLHSLDLVSSLLIKVSNRLQICGNQQRIIRKKRWRASAPQVQPHPGCINVLALVRPSTILSARCCPSFRKEFGLFRSSCNSPVFKNHPPFYYLPPHSLHGVQSSTLFTFFSPFFLRNERFITRYVWYSLADICAAISYDRVHV